jgi:hypothetical protein
MEKLFYSLEETAERLGKTLDEVREMAQSGQLEQFRDRERLMFKKQQVDILAGAAGEEEPLRLADSAELEPLSGSKTGSSISLADSGSPVSGRSKGKTGTPIERNDPKESTGISLLDLEGTDESDANAVTRVTASPGAIVDPGDERSASGTGGLLDLTREADDTSLGAGLLDDVFGGETVASQSNAAAGSGVTAEEGGSLFESPAGAESEEDAPVATAIAAPLEAYDGPGSGLTGGLMLGSLVALGIAAFTLILGFVSKNGSISKNFGDLFYYMLGACAVVPLLFGLVGWIVGRKS